MEDEGSGVVGYSQCLEQAELKEIFGEITDSRSDPGVLVSFTVSINDTIALFK